MKEKEDRAQAKRWYQRGEAEPNDSEVLCWSLLVCGSGQSMGDLNFWARRVLRDECAATEATVQWKPNEKVWPKANSVSSIYSPLVYAFSDVSWSRASLDAVALAMQAWRSAGQYDGLNGQLLSMYISSPPSAARTSKKSKPPPRYRSWAVVRVARIIHDHGPKLRELLRLDATTDEARPLVEVVAEQSDEIAALAATVRERDATIAERDAAVKKLQDAWRQAAKRLKDKNSAATEARRDERAKLASERADIAKSKRNLKRDIKAMLVEEAREEARTHVEGALKRQTRLKNEHAARARAAEAREQTLSRKVARLQKAAAAAEQEEEADDESEMEASEDDEDGDFDPTRRISFEINARRDDSGRFQAESTDLRAARLAQLARGVAPSSISANIEDVLSLVAPNAEIPAPCERSLMKMRGEVTIASEAMAAWRFAASRRVLFAGWDESTKFGDSVFAMTFLVEHFDGTREEVCLRAISLLPSGGTSKAVMEHIETRIFAYSRDVLGSWIAQHEKLNGEGSWAAVGGPSPDSIGLHRLAEDTVLMTDTCNAARCTRRLLGESIMRTMQEKVGTEAWEAMSIEERNEKYRFYRADCWQHLRNVLIKAMATASSSFLKEKMSENLSEFCSFERIEVDADAVIRAAFKQFHHGGEYAKGRGREFEAWRKQQHSAGAWMPFERAMGSRQDLSFDGCVPLFANRVVCLEFLAGYIDLPKSPNVLDKSLYTLLRCNEFVALLRAHTLWQMLFSEPFRWLAGRTGKIKDWSLYNMSGVLDLVEAAMEMLAADPSKLLDEDFDMFASVAAVPEFKQWRDECCGQIVLAADGKTEHTIYKDILQRARSPEAGSGDEQATAMTLELVKEMAARAVEKLHDKKIGLADKLTSQGGINAIGQCENARARTQGIDGTNDRSENKFAIADFVMRTYRGISIVNASGIVQQRSAHDFDRPSRVVSDRRKRKATAAGAADAAANADAATTAAQPKVGGGFFWRLSCELRHSLVEMARLQLQPAIAKGRLERQQHDQEKLAKREQAVQTQLSSVVEKYAEALEFFEQWQTQRWKTHAAVDDGLKGKSVSAQIKELRLQIEMRTVGCGWRTFETKWGYNSDEKEQTLAQLKSMLVDDLMPFEMTLERKRKLPTEAAPPQLTKRALKVLGTVDADAARIEAESTFNVALLLPKAEAARARREAAGISDRVEARQPATPPPFDTNLVGKRLEVCWPYKYGPDGKKLPKTMNIWASGVVKRVADGLTDKKSARAKKVLPAGTVLWGWDADPEYDEPAGAEWLFLKPGDWNRHVQYAWRYDPCELAPQGAAKPPPQAPRVDEVDPCVTDDEYDHTADFL